MASRSLSSTRTVLALLSTTRRGYAAAAGAGIERSSVLTSKKAIEGLVDSKSSSWVPDPVTGYYRPANTAGEIDAADLRAMLLSNGDKTKNLF